jgi:hypothetical protein
MSRKSATLFGQAAALDMWFADYGLPSWDEAKRRR